MLGVVGKVYTLPSSAPVILLLSLSCGVSHFCCHKLPLLLLTVSLAKTFLRTGSVGKLKKEDIMSERFPHTHSATQLQPNPVSTNVPLFPCSIGVYNWHRRSLLTYPTALQTTVQYSTVQ